MIGLFPSCGCKILSTMDQSQERIHNWSIFVHLYVLVRATRQDKYFRFPDMYRNASSRTVLPRNNMTFGKEVALVIMWKVKCRAKTILSFCTTFCSAEKMPRIEPSIYGVQWSRSMARFLAMLSLAPQCRSNMHTCRDMRLCMEITLGVAIFEGGFLTSST